MMLFGLAWGESKSQNPEFPSAELRTGRRGRAAFGARSILMGMGVVHFFLLAGLLCQRLCCVSIIPQLGGKSKVLVAGMRILKHEDTKGYKVLFYRIYRMIGISAVKDASPESGGGGESFDRITG